MAWALHGQKHVELYRETGGDDGHIWEGAPTLLLTTRGRKSGRTVTTPLIYRQDGDDYVIVASKGGSDQTPAWYLNLQANPEVEVQIKGERFKVRGRTATAAEKLNLWPAMVEVWPDYEKYQAKTSRPIPVIVLERVT